MPTFLTDAQRADAYARRMTAKKRKTAIRAARTAKELRTGHVSSALAEIASDWAPSKRDPR